MSDSYQTDQQQAGHELGEDAGRPGAGRDVVVGHPEEVGERLRQLGHRHVRVAVDRGRGRRDDLEHARQRRVGVLVAADLVGRAVGQLRRRATGDVGGDAGERLAQPHLALGGGRVVAVGAELAGGGIGCGHGTTICGGRHVTIWP